MFMALTYVTKNSQSRPSFLDQQWSNVGFRSFFPAPFIYKTPLGLIALALLSRRYLGHPIALRRWRRRAPSGDASPMLLPVDLAPLVVIIAVYATFALLTRLNIGHRHLLPLYPAIFIFCGSAPGSLTSIDPESLAAAVCLLISWDLFSSFAVRPHYLAYFNESMAGRRMATSIWSIVRSIGDRTCRSLKSWIISFRPNETRRSNLYLAYFGTAKPSYYGIDATILPEERFGAPLSSLRPGSILRQRDDSSACLRS